VKCPFEAGITQVMVSRVFMQYTVVGLFQASVSEQNSVTLEMEAACSFKTSGQSCYTMWCKAQKTIIWTFIGGLRFDC